MSQGQLTIKQKVANVRDLLGRCKGQIAIALPKHMTAERMLRVTLTAAQRNPTLLDCDPASLAGAVVQASQLGLEPDGVLGHAYLVPFRNHKTGKTDCQLIPGYRGLIDLARRSGNVSTVFAHVAHEKDHFDFHYGLNPDIQHTPSEEADPGPVKAAYAVCHLRDGGVQMEVMWKRQIDAIRGRSKAGNSGPWVTDYEEMAKKTVLRRLCKMLPVSVELQKAVALDELAEVGVPQDLKSLLPVDALPAIVQEPNGGRSGLDALAERFSGGGDEDAPAEPQEETPQDAAPASDDAMLRDQYRQKLTEATTIQACDKLKEHAAGNPDLSQQAKEIIAADCAARADQIRGKRGTRSNQQDLV